ncbi:MULTISPECIES: hypothetical protein [Streptomyces]|nr:MULTISPECIES: hypothetical protein [Streptomyces]
MSFPSWTVTEHRVTGHNPALHVRAVIRASPAARTRTASSPYAA